MHGEQNNDRPPVRQLRQRLLRLSICLRENLVFRQILPLQQQAATSPAGC